MPAHLDLYVILYLAMRRLNHHPVGVDAFVAVLKRNGLHYMGLYALLPLEMARVMTMSGMALLANAPAPLDDLFYRGVCRWLRVLPRDAWAVPVDNFLPLAFGVLADLRLGEAPRLLVVFHRLVALVHRDSMPVVGAVSAVPNLPECQYVAYLYLAIKLFLMAHPTQPDIQQWCLWLDSQRSHLPFLDHKYHQMDTQQLLELSDAQTEQYCQWVQDALVLEPYKGDDDLLGTMEKRLLRIFALDIAAVELQQKEAAPKFTVRHGALLETEVARAEHHLLNYFCYRFGLKRSTLQQAVRSANKKVMARLKQLFE